MTIVNTDSQICMQEYQYKENHPYTGTTSEYKAKEHNMNIDTSFDHLCKRWSKWPKPSRNLRR